MRHFCKNCKHEIVKRYNDSKLAAEWKHKDGGNDCHVGWDGNYPLLGGCLCHKAEPKEVIKNVHNPKN